MKTGEIIHGFKITSERPLAEHSATLYLGEHIKSGASLIFCDRKDSNKTFSITFKTVPEDDTGVFHIIEHSVLCGSRKFPVKEPFVDLLKSSLKTFLNAFTFPDKTMYPVSSRCDKDFLNLIDVYMDAVLHPMALELPEIFYQEGWHHELHEGDSEMQYKGVVLNEMRGAYSSVDDLEMEYITKLLYKGTPYAYDSGGAPDAITSLTYEGFKRSHAKYYHPSNSTVFLDGSVNLDETLSLIDSYLSEYERQAPAEEIPSPTLRGEQTLTSEYEIAENESEEGKERVTLAFPTFSFSEREKHYALQVAIDAIAGSNEAPLKKAILDSGLCEDMQPTPYDGVKDNSVIFSFKNIKREDREKIPKLFETELRSLLDSGIERSRLAASLNRFEFYWRELSGGGYPLGISLSIAAMDNALYGGDPLESLGFDGSIKYMRALFETERGFEKLVASVFLDAPYFATLYLTPSSTLGARREAALRERLDYELAAMSDGERNEVILKTKKIEEWQQSEDSAEAKATLPKLTLDDIPKEPEHLPTTIYKIGDNTVLYTDFASRGITHAHILFDASDFTAEELFLLSVFSELIENVDTDSHTCDELQTLIKSSIGRFSTSVVTLGKTDEPRTYFKVTLSTLDSGKSISAELMRELLLTSKFDNAKTVAKVIRQTYLDTRDAISQSGHTVALGRASAYVSSEAAASEYTDGIEFFKLLKALDADYTENSSEFARKLSAIPKRLFTRARMLVSYVGVRDDGFIENLFSVLPSPDGDARPAPSPIPPLGILNEGIVIPAQVSFAAEVGMAISKGERLDGAYAVARTILSYGYLWNEIRVQGGAYGAGLIQRAGGTVGFYTYRDPDANRSLGKFGTASDYLRLLAEGGVDITEYIIGAIGDIDPLYTPMSAGIFAFTRYLRGDTKETLCKHREQLLGCDRDDLLRIADKLDGICKGGAVCVVGGKDKLLQCGSKINTLVEIS